MSESSPIESILKRDRMIVIVALIAVSAVAWLYLIDMARDMASMDMGDMAMGDAMGMMEIPEWTAGYFLMMFVMWAVMMIGMMTPSAAPMVLVYASMARNDSKAAPFLSTGTFLGGYLLVWTLFSLTATLLQWGLDAAALLSPMMVSTSPYLGAGLLAGAGIFQMTPWKNACLAHCRNPIQFFMTHWRVGKFGALRMGLEHGIFCLGCCWLLMGLLFFGGVMNLIWIALITGFVLFEKVAPLGRAAGKVTGGIMIAAAVLVITLG